MLIKFIVILGNRENNKKLGSVFLSVILLLSISIVFSNYAYAETEMDLPIYEEDQSTNNHFKKMMQVSNDTSKAHATIPEELVSGGQEITFKCSVDGEILDIIGANTVVFPNREAAKRLVPMIFSDAVFGYFPIGDDLVIAEVIIPKKLAGKSVIDIDLRRESGLNIIALKKEDGYQQFVSGDHIIQEDEILLVSGSPDDISRFSGDKLPEIENRKKRNGLKSFF